MLVTEKIITVSCFHCGEDCKDETIVRDEKSFCCSGCMFVYQLLKDNKLDGFYSEFGQTGLNMKKTSSTDFSFLDDKIFVDKLLQYSINGYGKLRLYVPQIYCSACIWLLENLFKLNKGIIESRVDFLKKELVLIFREELISVRQIFELLNKLGYTPKIDPSGTKPQNTDKYIKSIYIKVGIAGFAFGNLMLFALPEYLSGGTLDIFFKSFLGILNIILSFFVLFTATDYFRSAYQSIKVKHINLDFPISLGILVLFFRSLFEIISGTGSGYIDSMAGLMFFLLLGKVFQLKTYNHLSFDKDFKSYFPISVLRKKGGVESSVTVDNIREGDFLVIRNNEIIPTDSILISDNANIDYSFITGESIPVLIEKEQKMYAGGKVIGKTIEIAVTKEFESSFLMDIWNRKVLTEIKTSKIKKFSDILAKYFTIGVVIISFGAFLFWLPTDIHKAINALTAILLIACPCAIALTMPFTFGTVMRIFGKNNFFVKNDTVIENLSKTDTIVFDKTGTLTNPAESNVEYIGKQLTNEQLIFVKSTVRNSTHPLSQIINRSLENIIIKNVDDFKEYPGEGIEVNIEGKKIRAGSYKWMEKNSELRIDNYELKGMSLNNESTVFISIDNNLIGCYIIKSKFRENLKHIFSGLQENYELHIISGDNEIDHNEIVENTAPNIPISFRQLPDDKIEYIEKLKNENKNVLMIGDGLNDAGALMTAQFGLAVSENIANFSPSSEGILLAKEMNKLPEFMRMSKLAMNTVIISYAISILYNLVGFYFAAQGTLSPLIAALLMPVSSVSVVVFTVVKTRFHGKNLVLVRK